LTDVRQARHKYIAVKRSRLNANPGRAQCLSLGRIHANGNNWNIRNSLVCFLSDGTAYDSSCTI
jgi:hypothetical protein